MDEWWGECVLHVVGLEQFLRVDGEAVNVGGVGMVCFVLDPWVGLGGFR